MGISYSDIEKEVLEKLTMMTDTLVKRSSVELRELNAERPVYNFVLLMGCFRSDIDKIITNLLPPGLLAFCETAQLHHVCWETEL